MVKVLDREGIQRMVRNSQTAGSMVGGDGLTSVSLEMLTDVRITNLSDLDALVYSDSLSRWVNYSIADMATKTWADGRFLKLTGGTLTGSLSIGGSMDITGTVSLANGGRINVLDEPSASALYIGNSNNAGWVRLSDMCSKDGTAGDTYWSIRTSGNAVFANVYSKGYVTALSDIRKKDVVENFALKASEIAKASLIKFTWKDKHDTDIHAGGIAQEWQKILPESVREDGEGTLSMDYGGIAFAASVSLAREVVSLQKTVNAQKKIIAEQDKKIQSLEARLARIEKMFAINANDSEE